MKEKFETLKVATFGICWILLTWFILNFFGSY